MTYLATFGMVSILIYLCLPHNLEDFEKELNEQKKRKKGALLALAPLLILFGNLSSFVSQRYLDHIAFILDRLDLESVFTPKEWIGLQVILPSLFMPLFALAGMNLGMFEGDVNWPLIIILTPILFAGIGFLPYLGLTAELKKMKKSISRELPFSLDMLTSAVQAGLDFSGAIKRMTQKSLKITPLKREFILMQREINLGKTRADALRRMAERIDLTDFNSVVAALIQADKMGSSLAPVLSNLSDDLRVKRFQQAEKLAMEAPVKMIFPLVIFIFPVVFIILMGPLGVQMAGIK